MLDSPALVDRLLPRVPARGRITTVAVVIADDGVLVARLVAGDDDAIGDAFDRHGPFVFGVARRVAASATTAEDVTQEVFEALWAHPERFDESRGSLRAFLGVLAYRRAVDAVRRDARRQRRETLSTGRDVASSPGADDGVDAADLAEVVRQAIARLPDDQRRAVELVFWHGCTRREAADVLGIPEGTAKSRLRLAKEKLADWLTPLNGESV